MASEAMALDSGEGTGETNIVAAVNLNTGDLFDQAAQAASQASEAPKTEPEPPKKDETTPAVKPEEAAPRKQEQAKRVEKPKQQTHMASAASQVQDAQQASAAAAAHREKLLSAYQIQLHEALERAKKHIRTTHDGDVILAITIAPSGDLISDTVLKSSGIPEADRAAVASIDRAAPFPPIPPEISKTEITLRVPFQFRVR